MKEISLHVLDLANNALEAGATKKELGDTPLNDPEAVGWIASYIRESLEALFGGEAL